MSVPSFWHRSRLQVVSGPDQGKEILIEGHSVQVGSGETCELILTDPTISTMDILLSYHWPGNVRELRNIVERLALLPGMKPDFYFDSLSSSTPVPPDNASNLETLFNKPFHEGKRKCTENFEKEYLVRLLHSCKGNISEVSRISGLSRQSCHRLISRYGLDT